MGYKKQGGITTGPTVRPVLPVYMFGETGAAVVVFFHRLVGVEVAGRDEWRVGGVHWVPILHQLLRVQPVGQVGLVPAAPLKHRGLYK